MIPNENEVGPSGQAHEAPNGADTTTSDPELDKDGRGLAPLPGGANIGGPRLYGDFIVSSKKLEEKLQDFSQNVLKLGSGHGLSKSSIDVKKGLDYMRSCFEKPIVKRKERVPKPPGPGGPQAQPQETNRSTSLLKLSSSLSAFSIALTDYDDYFESKTYSAIKSFQKEVLILSEALSYFSGGLEGDLLTPELDSFIRDRLSTAINQFKNAEEALFRFDNTGIPCIQIAQERTSSMMLNASTVAIFFAGVAATTLQYTGIDIGTTIGRAIQTLWFSSLVLSIGSAITSLLVFAWRQAVSSRTQRRLPMYIRFWSRSGYLVLLSASIIAFISGLIAYVYALQRTRAMFWVVTASTAFCAIGLVDVLRCYATDQWSFWKSRKTRALDHDVTTEKQSTVIWERLKNFSLLSSLRHFNRHTIKGWHTTRRLRIRLWGAIRNFLCSCYACRDTTSHPGHDPETGKQVQESENTASVECTEFIQSLSSQDLKFSHYAGKICDMQFSPCGEWLVVCTTSDCYAYNVYTLDYKFLEYYVQQVKWSPDGNRLLTRTKHNIGIWLFKNNSHFRVFELENNIKPGKSLVDLEWSDNNKFIALSNDADSMFTVHLHNGQQKLMEIRLLPSGLTIYEMTTMNHSTFILLLATRKVKYVSEEKGISCIIVYDMESSELNDTHPESTSWWQSNSVRQLDVGKIKSKVPLSKKARGIAAGTNKTRLIVTYEESMPEVWSIDKYNGTISKRCELRPPETKSKGKGVWGSASFVGSGEDLVACAEDGVVHFWNDTGDFEFKYFRSLPIHDQDEDEHDSNSDYDSDDGSDDDEKTEGAVFAWKFRSGAPTMASGYLRDLKLWSSKEAKHKL